jgi:hypothetical protein
MHPIIVVTRHLSWPQATTTVFSQQPGDSNLNAMKTSDLLNPKNDECHSKVSSKKNAQ